MHFAFHKLFENYACRAAQELNFKGSQASGFSGFSLGAAWVSLGVILGEYR